MISWTPGTHWTNRSPRDSCISLPSWRVTRCRLPELNSRHSLIWSPYQYVYHDESLHYANNMVFDKGCCHLCFTLDNFKSRLQPLFPSPSFLSWSISWISIRLLYLLSRIERLAAYKNQKMARYLRRCRAHWAKQVVIQLKPGVGRDLWLVYLLALF